jgi:hypothetical protein
MCVSVVEMAFRMKRIGTFLFYFFAYSMTLSITQNYTVNNELGKCVEAILASFEVLSRHFSWKD